MGAESQTANLSHRRPQAGTSLFSVGVWAAPSLEDLAASPWAEPASPWSLTSGSVTLRTSVNICCPHQTARAPRGLRTCLIHPFSPRTQARREVSQTMLAESNRRRGCKLQPWAKSDLRICFYKYSFIGTQPHSLISTLSMTVLVL